MPFDSNRIYITEADFEFENDISRNPHSLKHWLKYLEAKKHATPKVRNQLHERALKLLPGSYKLWFEYLMERVEQVKYRCLDDPAWEAANNVFERSLVYMHKMPRIWQEYCKFLMRQKKISKTRKTFDRALKALPITQHDKVWKFYLKFIRQDFIPPETAVRVWRRYLMLEPEDVEEFIDYLIETGYYDEAAKHLAKIVNDEHFISQKGANKHDLWMKLCELISKHPEEIVSLPVEQIIRHGLQRFAAEVGQIWCSLADYHIRMGHFEKAMDVYEEGIETVCTVKDFTQIFDAYSQFQETLVTSKMEELEIEGSSDQDENEGDEFAFTSQDELDMRSSRLEYLIERLPELRNSVLLRQNPHNIHEWHKRVRIFKSQHDRPDRLERVVSAYSEAVQTVDPHKAIGKIHSLWVRFAQFYEERNDLSNARIIFEKAVQSKFRNIDDLANVWAEYVEMELRHGNSEKSLEVIQRATSVPKRRGRWTQYDEETAPAQSKVFKSVKLWSLYADLEENFGTVMTTKAVYDRIIDLKVVTPQIILNYAQYLEENKYFEESFRAFEKGISLFNYPEVHEIWTTYLIKFVQRYRGRKVERTRELFDEAVKATPSEHAKDIFLLYAKFEEDHGLLRHAMDVYERATQSVQDEERYSIYQLYIRRAAEFFGVAKTREIYEHAIEHLPDKYARDMCLKYVEMERKLYEIDRARAIFVHGSQISDPRVDKEFWDTWYQFEVQHGNEDTFREMLRIQRTIEAKFSTSVNFVAAHLRKQEQQKEKEDSEQQSMGDGGGVKRTREGEPILGMPDGAALGRNKVFAQSKPEEVELGRGTDVAQPMDTSTGAAEENPEAIDIDGGGDGDGDGGQQGEANEEEIDLTEKAMPETLLGEKDSKTGMNPIEKLRQKQKENSSSK
eukprot:gb/GECH01004708.1/.p1 GENE.gb/GECH01004708.1/~~gb/GECH01004708.1/.p1  ORF type:complete len:902 (+),score=289.33 gb/GECH01004708.1/:1-2706(+)